MCYRHEPQPFQTERRWEPHGSADDKSKDGGSAPQSDKHYAPFEARQENVNRMKRCSK